MPDTDIPAIFAVADRHALSQPILTDSQRQTALEAIALIRELSPGFLDKAEQIITGGATTSAELFSTACTGSRVDSAMTRVLKALWAMEDAVFEQRSAAITTMGKEGATNGQ